MYVEISVHYLKEKRMSEKMNVADFQKLVCKLWEEEGEKWKMDYYKEHQKYPSNFKTFSLACHLMLKHLGVEVTDN